MDESNEKFWDYSFEQMADYDMPATIDLVLEKTKNEKLSVVAHS